MSHIRFSRFIVLAALAIAMLVPISAAAQVRVGVGFYGGPWGYYGPWGYPYGPYYGGYAYGPYGYGIYGPYGRPMGEVRIKSPDSNAQIYINGALAGAAHDLKKIYLAPGTYNIEQRIGSDVQKQRIYVVVNRSIKIEFGKPGTPSPTPAPPPPARPDARVAPPPPPPGRPGDATRMPPPPPPDADATPMMPPPPPPAPEEEQR